MLFNEEIYLPILKYTLYLKVILENSIYLIYLKLNFKQLYKFMKLIIQYLLLFGFINYGIYTYKNLPSLIYYKFENDINKRV
jgi:hypothetical protein